MKKSNCCIYIVLISFFLGCSYKLEDCKIEEYLRTIKSNIPFQLDSVCNKTWDTLYIMQPYSYDKIKDLNLDIPKKYLNSFKSKSSLDTHCILIFTKNRRVMGFADIDRSVADFSYVETIGYSANHIFYLNEDREIMSKSYISY